MGFLDSIGLGDVGTFVGDNSSWLKPLASAGVSAFGASEKNNAQNQYIDYLKQREDKNYQNSVDAYNAQVAAAQAGDANSAARAGAANAARAAKAGAARATEANRQAALKRASDEQQATYAKVIKMYAPFVNTALTELPQKQKTYGDSLQLQGMLNAYLNTPAELGKMNQAQPAYNINVPLPPGMGK